jgi:hypothetical protein
VSIQDGDPATGNPQNINNFPTDNPAQDLNFVGEPRPKWAEDDQWKEGLNLWSSAWWLSYVDEYHKRF